MLPYELDQALPSWPGKCQTKRERYTAKLGRPVRTWEDRASSALLEANAEGPRLPFTIEGEVSNTLNALRLVYAAGKQGKSAAMLEILLRLFHFEGKNLGGEPIRLISTQPP